MKALVGVDEMNRNVGRAKRLSRLPSSVRPTKALFSESLSEQDDATITELSRLLMEGEELLGMYSFESAVERFSECLAKAPYLATAAEGLAEAYDRLGQHRRASELDRLAATIRATFYKRNRREPVNV